MRATSSCAAAQRPPPTTQRPRAVGLGLSLDASDALGGDLLPGDRVDVVAIPPADGTSEVIVHGAVGERRRRRGRRWGGLLSPSSGSCSRFPTEAAPARRAIDAHADAGVTLIAASTVTFGPEYREPRQQRRRRRTMTRRR